MRDDWKVKAKVGFIFFSLIWKPFCKEINLHRPIQAQPAQEVIPLPCEIAMQGLSIQQIGRSTFPTGHFCVSLKMKQMMVMIIITITIIFDHDHDYCCHCILNDFIRMTMVIMIIIHVL